MQRYQSLLAQFQSQGRFFGGCCVERLQHGVVLLGVSIAGAILWGVLPAVPLRGQCHLSGFNRRGDSLGGAARRLGHLDVGFAKVSIAGAILWGVLPATAIPPLLIALFQSQGRFFGGCCPR